MEARTKQTIDFLQLAAEARCDVDSGGRKRREKKKKALDTLEELVSRVSSARTTAIQNLYEPLAELLQERAEMRRLWKKREDDHVFRELDRLYRPLAVPFEFDVDVSISGKDAFASSPLPEDLEEMANRLVDLGRACVSGDPMYLPKDVMSDSKIEEISKAPMQKNRISNSERKSHRQPPDWSGWNDRQFGLEMQSPWAGLLLEGKKTIETRAYDLPPALLGKRIEILQSQQGNTVSSLRDVVSMTDATVTRVGWCRFTHVIRYEDGELFDADQDAHWVTNESAFYPFKKGIESKTVYGWVVGEVGCATDGTSRVPLKTIVRRYRSLFELQRDESKAKAAPASSNNKKKKRRRY